MVETIPLEKPIFCSWVGMEVEQNLLGKFCIEYICDGKCSHCARSPQLDIGMRPDELLRNLRSCD